MWLRIARAGAVFALCFVASLIVVPIVARALDALLPGTGPVLYAMWLFPAYLFWLNGLYGGSHADLQFYDGAAVRLVALGVWLLTWLAFAWSARDLRRGQQVVAALVVIAVVTIVRELLLAACGLYVFLDAL